MYSPETPFDSIESAQQYLKLLADSIFEAKQSVEADLFVMKDRGEQITRALQLISYNLEKLGTHVKISRRILNDLFLLGRVIRQLPEPIPEPIEEKQETHSSPAHSSGLGSGRLNSSSAARGVAHP